MNSIVFGAFCRSERRRQNMTLADQAELMKIAALRISQIEDGEGKLLPEYFYATCDLFGLPNDKIKELFDKCFDDSNIITLRPTNNLKLYQLTIDQIKALRFEGGTDHEVR